MRRHLYATALTLLFVAISVGQVAAQLNMFWEEVGPNNMGNHTRAMAVDASGNVWAGSVGGGLWKSTNRGATWDMVPGINGSLAVSSIAVDGNKIYVGTGEKLYFEPGTAYISNFTIPRIDTLKQTFHQFSGQPGEGVYASVDGGATWDHNNGTWGPSSIQFEGPFSSIQKVATQGGRTFIATVEGLYWSDNADLTTVTKSTGTTPFTTKPIVDVEFAANGVVLAATQDSLYRSTNNGTSFGKAINDSLKTVSTSAPNNRIGGDRIEIAVAPSDANYIYVTGASNINGKCTGVWRSTDAGINWTRIAPNESATFQPFQDNGLYSLVLAVKPSDPTFILLGGEKLYKFDPQSGWNDAASHTYFPGFTTDYVPTPILSLVFDPNDDSTYYVGTDAEIVRTTDYGDSYTFKTKGFNNAHLYGVSTGVDYSVLLSDRYRGLLYRVPDSSNKQEFNNIYTLTRTGVARFSVSDPDHIISQGSDGGLVRSFNKGEAFEQFYGVPIEPIHASFGVNPDSIYVDRANATSGSGGLYDSPTLPVNAWALDEYIAPSILGNDSLIREIPQWLYLCSRHFVWVCTNPFGGVDSLPNWNRISEDLVQDFFGVGQREYLSALAVSGDNDHVVYVGTNAGKLFRIEDANDPVNMDLATKVIRVDTMQSFTMPNRWITDIEFDPGNPDNLIVTYGSYAKGDDRVFITNNAKAANPVFRSIQGNLPADLGVYTAAFHPDPNVNAILIGTEEGVYGTSSDYTGSVTWSNESTNVGIVPVTDITFRRWHKNINGTSYTYGPDYRVFIATHGRGAFKSSTLINREEQTVVNPGVKMALAPNPASDFGTVQLKLDRPTRVSLDAYNITGSKVAVIRDRMYPAGQFIIDFDVRELPAGVYLIKGEFSNSNGTYRETMKQIVVK